MAGIEPASRTLLETATTLIFDVFYSYSKTPPTKFEILFRKGIHQLSRKKTNEAYLRELWLKR